MRLVVFGKTHVGRVRKKNQDSLYFNAEQGLVLVADGIGGRRGGEVASAMAVGGIKDAYLNCDSLKPEEVSAFVRKTIEKVNVQIIQKGKSSHEIEGMATTLNCLVFVGDKLYISHMGDSRTYMYYRGNLWQLTFDHNIENYVGKGWLPEDTLLNSSKPGALVRAIGLSEECEVDVYEVPLRPGLLFLTCSDGLSGMVSDHDLLKVIKANQHRINELPEIFIELANKNGGQDNITVAIAALKRA